LVALFACLFAASWTLKSSAQQPAAAGQPQRPQPSPDAPAEQVFKNIQVLKGMPNSQLDATMDFFNSSLGVRCDFCHVRQGNRIVPELDDKEEKKTARRMIQMQMEMNTHHLADFGNTRISCYTCHHGSTDPARFAPMPFPPPAPQSTPAPNPPAAPAGGGGQAAAAAPAPLPSAEEVLNKYVAAVGGRDAVAKLKTRVMRGTREGARGGPQPVEVTFAEPDKFTTVMTIPAQGQNPQGEMRQAYSGAKGWAKDQRGAREMGPSGVASLRAIARYLSVVKIAEPFPSMKVVGRHKLGDRDTYVLEAKPEQSLKQYFFFDTQTGLLMRQLTLREMFLNDIPEQEDYEDYHDVDGVKVPFTVRVSTPNPNAAFTLKFTDVKSNVPVDETIFVMPAATPASPPKP
jgi:hypothetical protein